MYSHNRKNSRIQHLASLGWILEDKPTTKSPAHNYNQSLPYSHAVQQIMYVSSSTPKSRAFTPKMLELSQNPEFKDVKFYEMEMMASTTPMIKFGPQNCPIVFLFKGTWCETLLGIGGIEVVEEHVRGMLTRS
ncbi:hypothetical protein LTR05_005545 [Lithohypha guttulata]|uniref:Uncharacterized protein n=1 Tax=Lithohypha guttulata TaxID=1690604 RepID=A0AAN7SXY6_9EURO|nr:hypothetical protein LTR05_005545 [Lithohypha guttulata]